MQKDIFALISKSYQLLLKKNEINSSTPIISKLYNNKVYLKLM